ncbi:calcineurin-like phosphoesterase family protein [Beijerinckia sp. L45]|uniref:calcineurin-like phosphoesterase C-terminal domain-containing protein n=1 Tax=Beijerinckia sp. L45 TaxID=1641855 RepID=UPI00131AA889|nr:calcineurin-like phosphoesterase family protein [Beijerinckia sp. L45]
MASNEPTRRDVMVAGAAVTLAAATGGAAEAQTPATVTGTVREDISRTGGHAITDLPLPGVLVSNGREVVRTDANGRYTLPIEPGMTVFVIKPSGFAVPGNLDTHLPLFSYVYEPDGTPETLGLRYPGLLPTGFLPNFIDFPLIRVPEPSRFDVVLLTDPQPESTAEIEYVRDDVVSGLIGIEAAFGITCGDLMFDDLSMYNRYNRIIGKIGLPWWNIGGNHDLNFEAPDARHSRETFKRVFGATYYAHEYAGATFVMLDNVDYLGPDSTKPGKSGKYRGFFGADQLAFVAALLKETPADRLIVLVMHIPLTTYLDPANLAMNTVNAADLLKLLGDRPSVSFAGHTHSTEHHYLGAADGFSGATPHHHHVLTAVSGSWWSGPLDHRGIACADSYDGTPNGFHILSVDGASYTTRFVPAAEPGGKQMRIVIEAQAHQDDHEVFRTVTMSELLRSPITADQAGGATVLVNVFDGGPKTVVTGFIDGGPPLTMLRISRPDPFIQQVYGRYPDTIKPWVKPMASSHIWTAKLPAGLRQGTYAIKVKAVDEYGREHRDSMVLEVI